MAFDYLKKYSLYNIFTKLLFLQYRKQISLNTVKNLNVVFKFFKNKRICSYKIKQLN